MNKKECIEKLELNGISAKDADGVVMIDCRATNEKDFKKQVGELRSMIQQMGYTGSFGVKWQKDYEQKNPQIAI